MGAAVCDTVVILACPVCPPESIATKFTTG